MSDERPTSEQWSAEGQPAQGGAAAYPSAPSAYPSAYPSAPQSSGAPATAVEQPSPVRKAVRLMWLGAAISLVSLVVTLAGLGSMKSRIRDQIESNGQHATQAMINTAYSFAIVGAVVATVIAIALWLWMAWKNGQGRSWARIVATVLGVINVLSTAYQFTAGTNPAAANILAVINLVIAIAILVLLWRKESSDFYRARSAKQYV